MDRGERYTYLTSGFNPFMLRSKKSNRFAGTLKQGASVGSGKPINVDRQHMSGNLGDKLDVGKIKIDGVIGRIDAEDDAGNAKVRFGNISKDE